MKDSKTHIKVFVTKTNKFRATISPVNGIAYSVTIGGNEWRLGKANEHKERIKLRIEKILEGLKGQLMDI